MFQATKQAFYIMFSKYCVQHATIEYNYKGEII